MATNIGKPEQPRNILQSKFQRETPRERINHEFIEQLLRRFFLSTLKSEFGVNKLLALKGVTSKQLAEAFLQAVVIESGKGLAQEKGNQSILLAARSEFRDKVRGTITHLHEADRGEVRDLVQAILANPVDMESFAAMVDQELRKLQRSVQRVKIPKHR